MEQERNNGRKTEEKERKTEFACVITSRLHSEFDSQEELFKILSGTHVGVLCIVERGAHDISIYPTYTQARAYTHAHAQ